VRHPLNSLRTPRFLAVCQKDVMLGGLPVRLPEVGVHKCIRSLTGRSLFSYPCGLWDWRAQSADSFIVVASMRAPPCRPDQPVLPYRVTREPQPPLVLPMFFGSFSFTLSR